VGRPPIGVNLSPVDGRKVRNAPAMGRSRQKFPFREHNETWGPPRQDLDSFRIARNSGGNFRATAIQLEGSLSPYRPVVFARSHSENRS